MPMLTVMNLMSGRRFVRLSSQAFASRRPRRGFPDRPASGARVHRPQRHWPEQFRLQPRVRLGSLGGYQIVPLSGDWPSGESPHCCGQSRLVPSTELPHGTFSRDAANVLLGQSHSIEVDTLSGIRLKGEQAAWKSPPRPRRGRNGGVSRLLGLFSDATDCGGRDGKVSLQRRSSPTQKPLARSSARFSPPTLAHASIA
jgi:hypothetical protein